MSAIFTAESEPLEQHSVCCRSVGEPGGHSLTKGTRKVLHRRAPASLGSSVLCRRLKVQYQLLELASLRAVNKLGKKTRGQQVVLNDQEQVDKIIKTSSKIRVTAG